MALSYVFFGTPGFCVKALDVLVESGRIPSAVVCQPDKPKGRGRKIVEQPTKEWARVLSVPIHQPSRCKESGFLDCMEGIRPDLGLVFAFGQILPPDLLAIPRLGFLNIHPSLLPRYRGAAPLQWALINGDRETGVSILQVTPRLDDGDILLQETVEIGPEENALQLGERLAVLGGQLAAKTIEQLENGTARGVAQDEEQVVWAPALKKEDGRIDWSQPAQSIHNRIRGVQPWPGAYSRVNGKILKIHRATAAESVSGDFRPGEVVTAEGDKLVVAAGDGGIALLEVQLEGKKKMDVRSFLMGRAIREGDVLGA